MTHDEALKKVAKLLRLAESDNANEAALAAAMAQRLMDRHQLRADDLNGPDLGEEPDEPIREFEAPLDGEGAKRITTWRVRLAVAIAQRNRCRVFLRSHATRLVGRPSDAETVRYLFAYLSREVDRLAKRDAKGNGFAWTNNYRLGVVETIDTKLKEQEKTTRAEVRQEAAATSSSALVRVDRSIERMDRLSRATDEWVRVNMKLGRGRASSEGYRHDAREAGRRAGQEIRIGGARAGLGAGLRSLGEG